MGRSNKSLKICHVNVCSLLADTRLLDLEILCANNDIDVLCVTETWLSESRVKHGSAQVNLPGFQAPVRCDRASGRRGGGVAVYVRSDIPAAPVNFNSQLEAVCVRLHLAQRKTVYIAAVYRPPKSDLSAPEFVDCLESAMDSIHGSSKRTVCIVGDFNAKSSTWWNGQNTTALGALLANFAVEHGLDQVVDGPTRAVGTSAAAQLDLMFTNNASVVDSCSVLSPLADHCPTVLRLRFRHQRKPTRRHAFWDFNHADLPGLNVFLQSTDWSQVLSSTDASQSLDSWYRLLLSAVGQFVPQIMSTAHTGNKPWYSSFLCRLRRQRDRLFQHSKHRDPQHRLSVAYRKVRNWYLAELRHSERLYYLQLGSHLRDTNLMKSSRRWWSAAKSACGLQTRDEIPPLRANGKLFLSAIDRANCLNDVFATQCSAPPGTSMPVLDDLSSPFSLQLIRVSDVYKSLSCLNVWKAPGLDDVGHRILKECASGIAEPLCHIFNLSLIQGVFPDRWKAAVVQPIYKRKGDRSEANFYRPIALLPSVSKVFEGFVRKQLLAHCLENNVIPDEQFGFLPGRSAVWQLLSVLNDWERALEKGKCVHACFLDVTKAFDRVDHGLLLRKLASIGVRGSALSWFDTYLRGRSICTTVDHVRSSMRPITSGVPQGSVLGPLLFVIYFRDLPERLSTTSALFADDALMYDSDCRGSNLPVCCHLYDDLSRIDSWADTWNTTFNATKSSHMLVSRRHLEAETTELVLNGTPIPRVDRVKHLGLTITSKLHWSCHVQSMLQRIAYKVFILKRLAYRFGSAVVIKRLYLGVVRPSLEYAGVAWDSCRQADMHALERCQLSIARAVRRARRREVSNSDVLSAIGWPTLAWRRRRFKLLLLWRLLHGEGPPSLRVCLPPSVSSRSSYSFRNAHSLAFPICSSSHRLKSFLPSAIAIWNALPVSVSSATSAGTFLRLQDAYFSTDKFLFGLP